MSAVFDDVDSLLDATLDDLADIPEFKPFPKGAHRVTIKWNLDKKINDKRVIEIELKGIETVELVNPEDKPIVAGDSVNVMFQTTKKDGTKNEIGEGQFKEVLRPLALHFGTASNRDTIKESNGAECLVVTDIREDKKDPQNIKRYTSIVSLQVV